MHYFVTGHTGFKGAWLTVLLNEMGHDVSGFSLEPRSSSLYSRGGVNKALKNEVIGDIRDSDLLTSAIVEANPDRVIHLAAQPLVHYSYENPRETYEVNVMGTLNLLESLSHLKPNTPTLVVTTDKVYSPTPTMQALKESSELGGGIDPYSASKAMADIMTSSWTRSNQGSKIAIARAGNVIGGGDDSAHRLIPETVAAYLGGKVPVLRNPDAVRPWQHVLDCLDGYLLALEFVAAGNPSGQWNFGPVNTDNRSVSDVVVEIAKSIDVEPRWTLDSKIFMPETHFLALNSEKAQQELQWRSKWEFSVAIRKTVEWENEVRKGRHVGEITRDQVSEFLES